MKRKIYISLFTLLGFLFQFIVHAGLEQFYIGLLVADFEKWSFGLSWGALKAIHDVATFILVVAGLWFGYKQGKYWWVRIYGNLSKE